MLIARTGQVIIAPLSNVSELGLFTVAVAISDVPLIAAFAMRDALFGLNAKVNDAAQITTTSRMTVLLGAVGCIGLGATLPLWLGIIFGRQFEDAMVPAWMLMFSAIICIPGLMAAAGLSAWGRPGLTSLGMVLTLVANVVSLVLLVPRFGAIGAASASIVSNVVLVSYMVGAASRTIGVSAADFVVVRRSDVARVWQLGAHVIRRRRGSTAG